MSLEEGKLFDIVLVALLQIQRFMISNVVYVREWVIITPCMLYQHFVVLLCM